MSSASLLRPFPPLENDDAEALVQAFLFVEDAKAALDPLLAGIIPGRPRSSKPPEVQAFLRTESVVTQLATRFREGLPGEAARPPDPWYPWVRACQALANHLVRGSGLGDPVRVALAKQVAEDRRYICELEALLRNARGPVGAGQGDSIRT